MWRLEESDPSRSTRKSTLEKPIEKKKGDDVDLKRDTTSQKNVVKKLQGHHLLEHWKKMETLKWTRRGKWRPGLKKAAGIQPETKIKCQKNRLFP